MRERLAYFAAIAERSATFEAFCKENGHWLDMVGVELIAGAKYLTLRIQLDCSDYEEYYIIYGKDGRLTVSDVVGFQDDSCANRLIRVFTEEYTDEKEIKA